MEIDLYDENIYRALQSSVSRESRLWRILTMAQGARIIIKLLSHNFSLLKVFKNRNFYHFKCSKGELFTLSSIGQVRLLFPFTYSENTLLILKANQSRKQLMVSSGLLKNKHKITILNQLWEILRIGIFLSFLGELWTP